MGSSVNRKTIRGYLTTLFTAALVGDGKPVQAIYDYEPPGFEHQSPVVVITSETSDRRLETQSTRQNSDLYFSATIFVDYSDPANSEDYLDDVEKAVSDVIVDNFAVPGQWKALERDGKSLKSFPIISGVLYKAEEIPLLVKVNDN